MYHERLIEELRRTSYDVVIPMEDSTIEMMVAHREEIEKYTRLPLPDAESLKTASDKDATLQLASRLGIATPKTYQPSSEADLVSISDRVVIPRRCQANSQFRVKGPSLCQ